jgi:hypothetical protein
MAILEVIKQALPLLVFSSERVVTKEDQGPLGRILSQLMALPSLGSEDQTQSEISDQIRSAVKTCVKCMSVGEFIVAALSMLENRKDTVGFSSVLPVHSVLFLFPASKGCFRSHP